MKIVKVGVLAPTNKGIPLGVQGENRATQVEFDTRPWFREYPSGTVSAVARRYGDHAPYPLTIDVNDGTAVWHVSDTDTAKAGEGAVELTMTSAGTRVRSLTFKTLVTASLTDAPVDDDAWYGWLDKAVVKVDETVQSAQRKIAEVDAEWTGLKADVTEKVNECAEVAAQAASDAHHAKVDAQATAKALESAEGSVDKAEAAANRAVDASLAADDSAVESSRSALSAGDSAEAARLSADAAANSAGDAATSASSAADAASAASGSASAAAQSATDASNAKVAAQTAKDDAATSASNAATSASNAASSATAAEKSASDAAASVNAINIITPTRTSIPPSQEDGIAIGASAVSKGTWSTAIGLYSYADGAGATAIGSQSRATNDFSTAAVNGATTSRSREFSVGTEVHTSYVANVTTPSLDYDASNKKYTDDNDAKTLTEAKKYTDDNDAKTLTEAKKYTDDNTSNALVGNVSGKLLHVEDAWPNKPLSLTIDGAYNQDGTPSSDNPVPIEVIENPAVKVTGMNMFDISKLQTNYNDPYGLKISVEDGYIIIQGTVSGAGNNTTSFLIGWYADNSISGKGLSISLFGAPSNVKAYGLRTADETQIAVSTSLMDGDKVDWKMKIVVSKGEPKEYKPYTSQSLPITLPAEHPYLAALPDGTHDEIVIDKDGNASLVARVQKVDVSNLPAPSASDALDNGLTRYQYWSVIDPPARNDTTILAPAFKSVIDFAFPQQGMYVSNNSIIVGSSADPTDTLRAGGYIYTTLATPITYQLGKLDIPSLPETISNVWTEAELTTNMSTTYKRDINIAFENLVQAVVAAAAGE